MIVLDVKGYMKKIVGALLPGILLAGHFQVAAADQLTIAVAANFVEPMRAVVESFQSESQHEVRIVTGSSGSHFSQIMAGAPFDLFFSADSDRPQQLVQEGRIPLDSVISYAIGKLVLWMPAATVAGQPEIELRSWNEKLALSNPRLAPYGRAAIETLESLNLQSIAIDSSRLIRGESVAQTYQFIATGNVQLGFVALSQVLGRPEVEYWIVPQQLYQPIVQQLAVLRESVAARELLDYLDSAPGRDILLRFGYGLPSEILTLENN